MQERRTLYSLLNPDEVPKNAISYDGTYQITGNVIYYPILLSANSNVPYLSADWNLAIRFNQSSYSKRLRINNFISMDTDYRNSEMQYSYSNITQDSFNYNVFIGNYNYNSIPDAGGYLGSHKAIIGWSNNILTISPLLPFQDLFIKETSAEVAQYYTTSRISTGPENLLGYIRIDFVSGYMSSQVGEQEPQMFTIVDAIGGGVTYSNPTYAQYNYYAAPLYVNTE